VVSMGPTMANPGTRRLLGSASSVPAETQRGPGDLVVQSQGFMLASSLSGGTFTETKFDGVMGLSKAGDQGITPFYLHLRDQGLLEQDVFSLFYSNTDDKPGQLIMGGIDPSLHSGELVWHTNMGGTLESPYWEVALQAISIGGSRVWSCPGSSDGYGASSCRAMIDSGTSLIIALGSVLSSSKISTYLDVPSNCDGLDSFEDVTFTLTDEDGNPRDYTLTASQYTIQRNGNCVEGITSQSAIDGVDVILGDVFIRAFTASFDFSKSAGNGRIGLAPANQAGNTRR